MLSNNLFEFVVSGVYRIEMEINEQFTEMTVKQTGDEDEEFSSIFDEIIDIKFMKL